LSAELAAAREECRQWEERHRLLTTRDSMARREAEVALLHSEKNFEDFVLAMPVPAIIHRDAKFTLTNRAFAEAFGYAVDDLLGTSIFDIVDSGDRAYVAERVALPPRERGGTRTREHHVLHKDGTRVPVEVTTVPVFLRGELCRMGVVHDLRPQKQLEAQLIAADRLASLGRLSAAVGHEINNPLAYALGSLSLIDTEITHLGLEEPRTQQLRELTGHVRHGALRIRSIVQDLTALSREQSEAPVPVKLGSALDLSASMADHEIRHRARLLKDYVDLPCVLGSEARLGQVFLNLLVNAAQSIAEGDVAGNTVSVSARPLGDDRVEVTIADTGAGISPELASRIFEPFFSTKSCGGTGLGLSISRQIVLSLGGSITFEPNQPRGTRFQVILPSTTVDCEADANARASERRRGIAEARVLVVDDEPTLARTVAKLLAPHTVEIALGGRAAIGRLSRGERFDAILCDLHMNDGSGIDVYEHLVKTASDLARRMILMTGGAVGERAQSFLLGSGCRVLDKPFDRETLHASLEEVLRRSA